ncbi:PREDICTED: uncharacterized protein LOC109336353 [Lupinus angustifolius]|uniref:uncharacterized protein LOC109336353 n=1 Tax=Lupinus angustifolius TaxID=3871 RepID=UPI00092E6011|nr:PREDICTED: uncharacterized protein LOC109336353 [Lupinus angustifolius]
MAEEGEAATATGSGSGSGTIEKEKVMSPWEQHSAVISLPRFDYNAPSSLLRHSHSGFLITCTIKREKSATKEAMSILHKFVGDFNTPNFDDSKDPKENNTTKRRRTCTEGTGEETNSATANSGDGKILSTHKAEGVTTGVPGLSLVKLTKSGLLLLTFPKNKLPNTVNILSNIIGGLESGNVNLPLWCHRIFPIQATCGLNEKELQEVVTTLVKEFIADKQDKLERPLKFAVGYNRRGLEDTKFVKENSDAFSLLDRNKCFGVVASAVHHVVEDSVVDLRSPELSVLVEFLPLSGVPNGSIIVAVSVLPKNLVTTKPRLCIKALTSNTKEASVAQKD